MKNFAIGAACMINALLLITFDDVAEEHMLTYGLILRGIVIFMTMVSIGSFITCFGKAMGFSVVHGK